MDSNYAYHLLGILTVLERLDMNKDNRQSGVEYSSSFISYSILKDSAIYASEDLGSATVGGKNFGNLKSFDKSNPHLTWGLPLSESNL